MYGKDMIMNKQQVLSLALVAACAVAVSGCAAGDKTGSDAIVLHFATIDGNIEGGGDMVGAQTFVSALEDASGGRMTVELETEFGELEYDAEARLVAAIAAGDVDGGWPGARSFAAGGITGLEPLEMSFTIESTAAQAALVEGDAPDLTKEILEGSGVHSLGLLAGALRRPFATSDPLVSAADWTDARFRVWASPLQEATVRALGGEPVPAGLEWRDRMVAGELDGADFSIVGYEKSDSRDAAQRVTGNVAVSPKLMVLSISSQRWESLSDQQRAWMQDAADQAVAAARSADFAGAEEQSAEALCAEGFGFDFASEEELRELRTAVQPMIDDLSAAEESAELMEAVLAAAEKHPQPDSPRVSESCATADGSIPAGAPAIPDGIYRAQNSVEDVENAGLSNGPGNSGIWTLTVTGGEYALTCRVLDHPDDDCGGAYNDPSTTLDTVLEAGYLRGDDDRVWIVYDASVHDRLEGCGECHGEVEPSESLDWGFDGAALVLTDPTDATEIQWVVNPWEKIG